MWISIRDSSDIVKTVWISLRDDVDIVIGYGVDIVIGYGVDIVKNRCGYR